MESILKSDIFFFVTTICIFAITAILLMILANILHIVKRLRKSLDRVHDEADGFINDLSSLRSILRETQFGLKPAFDAIKVRAEAFAGKKSSPRKKAKTQEEKPMSDTTGDQI